MQNNDIQEFLKFSFYTILWLSEIRNFVQNCKKHKIFDFDKAP